MIAAGDIYRTRQQLALSQYPDAGWICRNDVILIYMVDKCELYSNIEVFLII